MKQRTNKLPLFFNYDEENADTGYETIQDFFVSWTIRCAVENCKFENAILHEYAKKILYVLIFGVIEKDGLQINNEDIKSFIVKEVRTKRQFGQIDLVAEIKYLINDEPKECVLSIENKWYSGIRQQQLEKSYEFMRRIYEIPVIDIVLFCDDEKISSEVINHCLNNKYKYLTIPELKDYAGITFEKPTGNELFDEYWLNF